MSGVSRYICECKGQHCDGVHKGRCRLTARVELRVAQGRPTAPWWQYCEGCADRIQASGLTRECVRRPFTPKGGAK